MLTHEQAVALRNVSTLEWGFVVEFDKLLVGMWTTILRIETREWVRVLTDAGKAALAAYDAEWVMVRREDVAATVANFESHSCCASLENVAANFRAVLEVKC